jgi:hypothetical protein
VWNVGETGCNGPPIYNLQMIASTARIKWRPQYKYQLGSCAQLMDFGVNIWDVRRPYVAFATFGKHRDIATGAVLCLSFRILHQALLASFLRVL